METCGGQEADAVILSLVTKPNPYLTINRFTVALTRARKKLFVLTDFSAFHEASRDRNWDCAGLASDMLAGYI